MTCDMRNIKKLRLGKSTLRTKHRIPGNDEKFSDKGGRLQSKRLMSLRLERPVPRNTYTVLSGTGLSLEFRENHENHRTRK